MLAFYEFSKIEEKRYTEACEEVQGEMSMAQLVSEIYHLTNEHVSDQTLRNWWNSPGAIPSTMAVLLSRHFYADLGDLCPWLKPFLRKEK